MLLLRRFLVLIALFFWQGGFTFYAAIVVPVGQHVFGHLRQGFITRQVTVYLNLAGAVALTVLVWEQLAACSVGRICNPSATSGQDGLQIRPTEHAARDPTRWRSGSRWLLWTGMVSLLLWLFWLHGRLDELLVVKGRIIRDPELFHTRHRLYLWISTVQWACGLLYLFFTLVIWRKQDGVGKQSDALLFEANVNKNVEERK